MKYNMFLVLVLLVSCSLTTIRSPSASYGHDGPGCIELASPEKYKKVWAISDVHGQLENLKTLLMNSHLIDQEGNWLARNELLIVVGDSIDKGPSSKNVLDLWIKLSSEATKYNSRVIHLLGNHEAEFLADPKNPKVNFPLPLSDDQMQFLRQMPIVLRLGSWVFVHAGKINNKYSWNDYCKKANNEIDSQNLSVEEIYKDKFITGDDSSLEAKNWWKDENEIANQIQWLKDQHLLGIVFGHQTKAFQAPYQVARAPQKFFLKIDSGMGEERPGEILMFPSPSDLNESETPQAFRMISSGQKYVIP